MRITGNWIGHHGGAWAVAPARETKIKTLPLADGDDSDEPADWRDALPFWIGFAALAAGIVGIDILMVWACGPR